MKTSRRIFLKSGALAVASVGLIPGFGPNWLRDAALAAEKKGRRKVMVCIFLRGAWDGLSVVVPHGDADYYKLRNSGNGGIALARTGEGAVLDLDGQFGLHPALAPLAPLYKSGFLAPIHAVGSPNPTRSHFDAQDFMESATPGNKSTQTGWLARVAAQCPQDQAQIAARIQSVALTPQMPRSLAGDSHALAFSDLASFGVGKTAGATRGRMASSTNAASSTSAQNGFEALYAGAVGDVLHGAGEDTFDALKLLQSLNPARYVPAKGANYGRGKLGESMRQIAQLIKADVGVEIAFAEMGGWDTHVNQGAENGQLARRLNDVASALSAFWTDLGDRMDDVVVLTVSEFGRTARQNPSGGTDHGHGTCFLAMGGKVNGGKVITKWPGLSQEQLFERRDLAVTTDFRSVFGEIANRHLGVKDLETLFPGGPKANDFRGVLKI